MTNVAGLLLAAGAGMRMGRPKALITGDDGTPWVVSSARALTVGGCTSVTVVVGADRESVRVLLAPLDVIVVEATDWAAGMGASLRAGLLEMSDAEADAVLVHLVDLPDVGADVVRRMLEASTPAVLARADYGGAPGHPVLIGREHWAAVADSSSGDRGARDYLAGHDVLRIDCSDLAAGQDVDRPRPMLGR